MSPKYVRPYIKAQKNDPGDAKAIAEAAKWPTIEFRRVEDAGLAPHTEAPPLASIRMSQS
jgi:hypothetical protein